LPAPQSTPQTAKSAPQASTARPRGDEKVVRRYKGLVLMRDSQGVERWRVPKGRPDGGDFAASPIKTKKAGKGKAPLRERPDDGPQMDENGNWVKPAKEPEDRFAMGGGVLGGAVGRGTPSDAELLGQLAAPEPQWSDRLPRMRTAGPDSPWRPVTPQADMPGRVYDPGRLINGKLPSSMGDALNALRRGPGTELATGGGVGSRLLGLARKYASGGAVTGALIGNTGGRADKLKTAVRPGSHIIPADVVSHHGEGNTLAGFEVMQRMFGDDPPETAQMAAGGEVPVYLSDGEYAVSPEGVERYGGHEKIDQFILASRAQAIETLKRLPPPAK
jgi:hypothetical protein